MTNLADIEEVKVLKSDFDACLKHPQGDNVIAFLESVCNWYPLVGDSSETNDVIARDARRQVLATIKTFLKCSPEQIQATALNEV